MTRVVRADLAARLMCLSAGRNNDAEIERTIASGVDWTKAFLLAERENAFPVFWQRVAPFAGCGVPPEIAEQMQRRSMVAEFTLRHQERLLARSVRSLAEIGIEVVLLKGAALAATIYGSPAQRPMGDADVLVRRSDAQRAWNRLLEEDWEWHRDSGLDEFYAGHQHMPPLFDRARAGASLEVHTDLLIPSHPFGALAESVWAARQPAKVGEVPTWAPSPNHLLLHACLHFAWANELERAPWNVIRDVDALARSGLVQWEEFVRLARASSASTSAYWALRLSRDLTGAAIPEDVLARLSPGHSPAVLSLLERHLVAGLFDATVRCPSTRVRRALWEAAIRPKRSGHGRARPWVRDREYTPAGGYASRRERPSSARKPTAWVRYLRRVVEA